MSGLRARHFRTRIFLASAGLACAAIALDAVLVQQLGTRLVRTEFSERFEQALAAFGEFQEQRTGFLAREIESLAATHPQLRTVLSTATLGEADLGLGGEPDLAESLRDANARLQSLAPSLALHRASEVFAVLSATGTLLYSKLEPTRAGDSFAGLELFQRTANEGAAGDLWLPGEVPAALLPHTPAREAFYVLGGGVSYGEELHGVVLVGYRLDREVLAALARLARVEVALYAGDHLLASSLAPERERQLPAKADALRALAGPAAQPWKLGGETFLAQRAPIAAAINPDRASFAVFGSVEARLAALRRLQLQLALSAGVIVLAALAASWLIARSVTQPVVALARAARRVGAGDLEVAVEIAGSDELAELGGAFNEMARGLRERDFIRQALERLVSRDVAAEVLANPGTLERGGTRRQLTVLFLDLGGFSALAEQLPPERVVEHLNQFFDAAARPILAHSGTIKEFQGDAIVAFWGAPLAEPRHAEHACLAALAVREELERLAPRWRAQGLPELHFRMGLHSADLVVGEIGAAGRTSYGVVGDGMNLASRLEGANKHFGTRILISEATRDQAGESVTAREIDRVRVVGRRQPLRIFELLARKGELDPSRAGLVASYAEALQHYRAGAWDAAEALLVQGLERVPHDGPSAHLLQRVRTLRAAPSADPGAIFELDRK